MSWQKYRFVLLTVFLLLICAASALHADSLKAPSPYGPEGKRFGLGIILGDPTGLTGKGYVADRLAIDGIVSWSFVDEAFTLIGDVTHDFFDLPVDTQVISLPFYAGIGGKVAVNKQRGTGDKTAAGVRIPVGLSAQWTHHPVELFLEIAPGIELVPSSEFDLSGGLGGRFYF